MRRGKVLFNFVPVAAGGGLQNSLSFLSFLCRAGGQDFDFLIVCRRGSKIAHYCAGNDIQYVTISGGVLSRLIFEFFGGYFLAKKNNVNLVFSLFGGSPFLIGKKIRKVCGFAYSNIIESDVDFWWFCGKKQRLVKRAMDVFRLRSAMNSNCVILETDRLATLAKDHIFRKVDIEVIHMSPSSLVVHREVERAEEISGKINVDILYLCGAHRNKRIEKLAPVVSSLKNMNFDVRIVTTLPTESELLKDVQTAFHENGVARRLKNIGPVPPESLSLLFDKVDGVINVALLESFSNNWVEAWASSLPLFVTDAAWARESCHDAAVYIDVDNPAGAATKIKSTYESSDTVKNLVSAGKRVLNELPTPKRKFEQYMDVIGRYL